ncbi:RHS repeat-associated core domain-containing protein, partial [Escherichia marmotae]|nr:RHS repeat-associated core domain-containing protein [Escherichia marmotae]MED8775254.1 RHS repeat-associated core domain-containing protein [Escherichia marmotae]
QYSYNGQDELLKTRHSRRGEKDYFYDPTGHITACRSEDEGYLASWQYDAAGNLLGRRAGERATAENSVVPFNRLLSYRGVHYRYDEYGRVVEKQGRSGTQSYRYDAEHRMVEVTTARETYRYVYDALGRRTEKQHISPDGKPYNRTKFLWDGMRLAQESRPEGISRLYIYSDQGSYEPLARVDKAGKEGPNRILYFHTDVNGAPEEMTDSDGKIVWETGYQVWGNTIQEKDHGRVEQNLRYQGQYLDRETGLHYNLHRYYDPDVGRFIVTDPIGLAGGLNLYAYAPNPLGWIDPLGLSAASDLPQLKGRSPGAIGSILTDNGFNLDKQTSTGNQTWSHADGSKVRVDPYGNQSMTMKNGDPLPKSGANAHVHKYDPGEVPLNDRGIPSTNPNETHIGIRNPNDYPTKRGRAHGCGA